MDKEEFFISEEEINKFGEKNFNNVEPMKVVDVNIFNVLTVQDITDLPNPPMEYVIHPILGKQGVGIVYAAAGTGKTLFTLNLAYAIAGGKDFLKYTCPIPRKVLYVDGEMPFGQMQSRLLQIIKHSGELDNKENLMLLTPDKQDGIRIPKIDDVTGQYLYKQMIEKYNIEVIVFDNLSMLSTIDENKSNEWGIIQDWFLSLRMNGTTIILVHHAGKDKSGYRGTSKMGDNVDFMISLQDVTNDGLEEDNFNIKKMKVVYQKNRHFGGKDALDFEVSMQFGQWNYQSNELTEMEKVVQGVKSKMSQRDIAKDLHISQTKVFRLVEKATKLGILRPSIQKK